MADRSGSLAGIRRHDYLPFGEEVGEGVGGRTWGQGYSQYDGVRQGFTGYEEDNETGLNFAEARYFSSTQGRFTSVDPALSSGKPAEPQSWNRYTYTINNPLKYVDPSGLIWGFKEADGVRTFRWFDGDEVGEGFTAYNSSHYVGQNEVLWLDSGSSDYLRVARSNFSDSEYASIQSGQGSNSTSFSQEQLDTVNRGIANTIRTGPQGALMKAVAGSVGSFAGSIGMGLNLTFGAAAREARRLPPVLFHYADDATAPLINSSGQIGAPGAAEIFFTNNGSYSPAMARELLALPPSNSAGSLFAVDSQVLSRSSLLRSEFVPASREYNRLGGGFQFVFSQPARGGFKQIR